MHRTEGANHSSNLFVDGPPGTTVEEDWLNTMQEELAYAIEQSGGTLKTAATETSEQLKTAIDDLADTRIDATDLRRKNALINGDFNTWQRGTSFAAIATDTYSADRFVYVKVGTMVHTVSRDTDVPTQAESGHKSNYSLKIDCTTADAAIGAADHCRIQQKIEGFNFAPFMGNTATLSFWAKATKTGIYCVSFRNSVGDRSYVAEFTINSASTWEKKIITLTFSDSTGTWDYIDGIGLHVTWSLAAGTNLHTTAGAWQNGSFTATVNQVNGVDNVANDFWLAQPQLEMGDVATPFESVLIQQELALCQRYYCKSYDQAIAPGTNTDGGILTWFCDNLANADSILKIDCAYPVTMRSTPTMTTWDRAETSGKVTIGATDNVAPGVDFQGERGVRISGAAGLGNATKSIFFHYTADAEI